MNRSAMSVMLLLLLPSAACSGVDPEGLTPDGGLEVGPVDDGGFDAGPGWDGGQPADAGSDAGPGADAGTGIDAGTGCFVASVGVFGECQTVTSCAAQGNRSTAGSCPGPAAIECCWLTPRVADNPPVPAGWKLMQQASVTSAMTTWAVAILHDPTTYPMFSTTTQTFGSLPVLARVEWHPPDFQNSVIHRGVTLYQPI